MKRIIYNQDNGVVAIIVPTPEVLQDYTIEEIAAKDVPAGVPYKIIDIADVPTDRTFRGAWEIDESLLTDGIGAEHSSF